MLLDQATVFFITGLAIMAAVATVLACSEALRSNGTRFLLLAIGAGWLCTALAVDAAIGNWIGAIVVASLFAASSFHDLQAFIRLGDTVPASIADHYTTLETAA